MLKCFIQKCSKVFKIKKEAVNSFLFAEREGFEPPEPLSSTVFKTAAIDHSAISPVSIGDCVIV